MFFRGEAIIGLSQSEASPIFCGDDIDDDIDRIISVPVFGMIRAIESSLDSPSPFLNVEPVWSELISRAWWTVMNSNSKGCRYYAAIGKRRGDYILEY